MPYIYIYFCFIDQKPKEKKIPNSESSDKKNDSDPSRFNEMKLSNNTCSKCLF